MRKAVYFVLAAAFLMASLPGCHKTPSPDDPTLKQNVLTKEKAADGAGGTTSTPPPAPPAGSK
jgi:hypothetical protein